MVWKQDVILNLSSLFRNNVFLDGQVEASGQYMPKESLLGDDFELEQPLDYQLVISSVGDEEFLLQGKVSGLAVMPCRRCLKPVEVSWQSDLMYSMEYRPGTEELTIRLDEDDDEVLVFGRPEVDFTVLLTEVFTVDRPLTAAHEPGDPECEDLAGTYGTDHEHAGSDDSPFASLKDFDVESTEE